MSKRKLSDLLPILESSLPPTTFEALWEAARIAEQHGQRVYLVGGAVRDLLIGLEQLDVDLTVVGDALALALALAGRLGGRASSPSQFGTAKVHFDGQVIDVATAREETYPRPGALPVVRPAESIEADLFRRDFTINAMALELVPERSLRLVDPLRGLGDLKARLVRAIHEKSFQDDPTRAFRAARYEQRLGFRLETETETFIRKDARYLDQVTGERVWSEIERTLQERQPNKALLRARDLGLLQALHPCFAFSDETAGLFSAMRDVMKTEKTPLHEYVCLVFLGIGQEYRQQVARRLRLPGGYLRVLEDLERAQTIAPELAEADIPRSRVYSTLHGLSAAALRAFAIWTEDNSLREKIGLYLRELKDVRTSIRGDDITAIGVPHGPEVGAVLGAVLTAKLDKKVNTRAQELALAKKLSDNLKSVERRDQHQGG